MLHPFIGFLLVASSAMPVGQKIITTSLAYGVDPIMAIEVLKCESGLRHDGVYGDKGKAYGIAQFWKGTFDAFKKEAGVPSLSYYSENDQIELALWGIRNGKAPHWSCWRKVIHKYS